MRRPSIFVLLLTVIFSGSAYAWPPMFGPEWEFTDAQMQDSYQRPREKQQEFAAKMTAASFLSAQRLCACLKVQAMKMAALNPVFANVIGDQFHFAFFQVMAPRHTMFSKTHHLSRQQRVHHDDREITATIHNTFLLM